MTTIDLSLASWQVAGWRPYAWQLGRSQEIGFVLKTDFPPVPAVVPGSVQAALKNAGIIEDWLVGLNSLDCEWVENRHWEFFTDIGAEAIPPGSPVELRADGLDYSGSILIDNRIIADFSGALLRHRFDLGSYLADGKAHRLGIVFHETPREQGQIGFSSRSHLFKPRFSYGWDWCPRFVPIGIWDDIKLLVGRVGPEVEQITTTLTEDQTLGKIHVRISGGEVGSTLRLSVRLDGKPVSEAAYTIAGELSECLVEVPAPDLWHPNGYGAQILYRLEVHSNGESIHETTIGFKHVFWRQNPGASADAIPWVCVVNGKPVFLAGVNWTPVSLDYHELDERRYRRLIDLYKDLGCTLLRVWGGAFLERDIFYRLCDEAGLMVWQEFPLSSSGIENEAPNNPNAIATLGTIALDYIKRRSSHVSLILWCGGNELFRPEAGISQPLNGKDPCLAALALIVEEADPDRRFLPTSPSGPVFGADEANFGKGIHHHVHGPWGMPGSIADWKRYWTADDSTLRSEVGMPGASSASLINKYAGTQKAWPADRSNPLWVHGGDWWIQWDRFKDQIGDLEPVAALEKYCGLSRELQASALGFAAASVKARFPRCGGFFVWMGHDCFPCTSNTSIIDIDGNPKPAYWSLKEVFRS